MTSSPLGSCILLVAATCCAEALAQDVLAEKRLRHQLQERDAQILILKKEIERLRAQGHPPAPLADTPPPTSTKTGVVVAGTGTNNSDDEELATALESSLVRQGGAVLQPRITAVEPQLSYFYDEPGNGRRRDSFSSAISLRYGLPAATQADLSIPYVIRDHQSGVGSVSGVGDVRLGLTRQLVEDRQGQPAVLVSGRWRFPTGEVRRTVSTGSGQHGLELGVTLTKRADPVLLIGGLSYTANFGSAQLGNDTQVRAGNLFGARLGANLAATPDTSFYWGVSYNTGHADRYNNERVAASDRARGYLELSATRVIGRGRFLNVGVALGVTPAAPRFAITASLPIIF